MSNSSSEIQTNTTAATVTVKEEDMYIKLREVIEFPFLNNNYRIYLKNSDALIPYNRCP